MRAQPQEYKKMETIQEIFTDQIDDPRDAMRTELDREALFDLAANIKQNGLINPITVRPVFKHSENCVYKEGDKMPSCEGICFVRYEVVAGHRRLSACKIAGLIRINCVVRVLDDKQTFEIMAAENLERADVDPVDEAIFISKYLEKTGKTIAEVASSLKRSIVYVKSRIEVGNMPEYMRDYLKSGQLKLGVALVLNQITDERTRHVWTELAVRDGANIAQAEFWLMDFKRQLLPGGILSDTPPEGFMPDAPQVVQFTCAIDGEKYDARLFRSVMIYEDNLAIFNEFVSAFRTPAD